MKRRISFVLAAALVAGLIAGAVPAGAAGSNAARFDARRYLKQHGYLPLRGVAAALVAAGILTRISVAWNQPLRLRWARALRHFMTAQ